MRRVFEHALERAEFLLNEFRKDDQALEDLVRIANLVADCFRNNGRVLACGNGGSMADAMHFAEEWSGRFRSDRRPYPAFALSDPAHLTCVANDFGFDQVFARQVEAFGQENDVLFVLSTSGNSPNIIEAAKVAKAKSMKVVGFLGRDGGAVKVLCDVVIIPPGEGSDRIQELHMLALHALIEAVEKELGHN